MIHFMKICAQKTTSCPHGCRKMAIKKVWIICFTISWCTLHLETYRSSNIVSLRCSRSINMNSSIRSWPHGTCSQSVPNGKQVRCKTQWHLISIVPCPADLLLIMYIYINIRGVSISRVDYQSVKWYISWKFARKNDRNHKLPTWL